MGIQGMHYRSATGKKASASSAELMDATWQPSAQGGTLTVAIRGGAALRFGGFREETRPSLARRLSELYGMNLRVVEPALQGWNWGQLESVGRSVRFVVAGKMAFEIPATELSQVVVNDKNELHLELMQDDTAAFADADNVLELRFSATPEGDELRSLQTKLLDAADLGHTGSKGMAVFSQVQVMVPRGRYDVEMHASFMRFLGKSYDYRVMYKNIARLTELPVSDRNQGTTTSTVFVISLDKAIRQGQTHYPHLVLQFPAAEETTLVLNVPEETLAERYADSGLSATMEGPSASVFRKVIKALTGEKVTAPGTFSSSAGLPSVRCAYKTNDGYLYPLERGLMFILKPPVYVPFSDVSQVEFSRMTGAAAGRSARTFDVLLYLRNGSEMQFSSIDRAEFRGLFAFLAAKNVRMKNGEEMAAEQASSERRSRPTRASAAEAGIRMARDPAARQAAAAEDDDDEDDDEFNPLEDDEDEDVEDDDDEDDDEDFSPSSKRSRVADDDEEDDNQEYSESSDAE